MTPTEIGAIMLAFGPVLGPIVIIAMAWAFWKVRTNGKSNGSSTGPARAEYDNDIKAIRDLIDKRAQRSTAERKEQTEEIQSLRAKVQELAEEVSGLKKVVELLVAGKISKND